MNKARSSKATKNKTERMTAAKISGNWNGTARAEWYTCTGELIAFSGLIRRRIVIIADERNEGNTRSGGSHHDDDGGS